jgi:predicted nucleic acid-binding protein
MFESRMLMFYEIRGDDLLEAAIISDEYSLKTNDAAIIANMLRNGVEGIATDNVRDFSRYPGIEVYNPINR